MSRCRDGVVTRLINFFDAVYLALIARYTDWSSERGDLPNNFALNRLKAVDLGSHLGNELAGSVLSQVLPLIESIFIWSQP